MDDASIPYQPVRLNAGETDRLHLEPGSPAIETFEETFSGPIGGLGAFCFVKSSRVIESSPYRVTVEVRYLATQNPMPGWSEGDGHLAVFDCIFAESGLIDTYELEN